MQLPISERIFKMGSVISYYRQLSTLQTVPNYNIHVDLAIIFKSDIM